MPSSDRRQLGLTTLGNAATLLAGGVVQVALAVSLGVTDALDRFLIATAVPTFLSAALGTAALQLLVPALHRDSQAGTDEADHLSRLLLGGSVAAAAALQLLASFILAALFGVDDTSTVSLLRVLALGIPLYTLLSLQTAVQHARGSTVRASLCAAVPALVMALSAVAVGRLGIFALAWGQLVGYAAAAAAMGEGAALLGRARVHRSRRDGASAARTRRSAPMLALVAGSVHLLMPVVERRYGVMAGAGAVAALGYASRLAAMTAMVASAAVGAMAHAGMSRGVSRADRATFASTVARSLSRVLVLGLAGTCLLASFAQPVAEFLTGVEDTPLAEGDVAALIRVFSLAVIGMGVGEVVGRAAYVSGWYRALALVTVVSLLGMVAVLAMWPGTPSASTIAATEVAWWSSSSIFFTGLLVRRVPPLGALLGKELGFRWRSFALLGLAVALLLAAGSSLASVGAAPLIVVAVVAEVRRAPQEHRLEPAADA